MSMLSSFWKKFKVKDRIHSKLMAHMGDLQKFAFAELKGFGFTDTEATQLSEQFVAILTKYVDKAW